MTLRLHDARRGGIFPFAPVGAGPVGMYVCGVTPYDTGHLGNTFTYLAFDVLHRYLEYLGHEVTYVQNLTDVDDDILRRAREVDEDYLALGDRHATAFLAEMAELNWLPPDRYPRATEHIPQMVEMIEMLLAGGFAYRADAYVFFSIDSWPTYGELSRLDRTEMLPIANERGNRPDLPGKRDPLDLVLWQPSLPDEPEWDSPWGRGRPGWHIECSAMSTSYLGTRFEIHGGGADLIFPHHESELAQTEAASGAHPWVAFWTHAGMLRHDGEKMSKSLGNLVLVRDLLGSYSADAIRHYLIGHHYRSEVDYHDGDIDSSRPAVERLSRAVALAEGLEPSAPGRADPGMLDPAVAALRSRFMNALDADLDTPSAIVVLDELAALALRETDAPLTAQAGWMVRELGGRILGMRLASPALAARGQAVAA